MKDNRFFGTLVCLVGASALLSASGCGAQRNAEEPGGTGDYYDSRDHANTSDDEDTENASVQPPGLEDGDSSNEAVVNDGETPSVLVRRAPESDGPLDGDRAGQALYENAEQLAQCYSEAGSRRSGSGVAFVIFDVQSDGVISDVIVGHSDVRNMDFVDCIERSLATIEMPEAEGKSVIQAYLVFGADDEDDGRRMLRSYRAARAESAERGADAMPLTAVRNVVQGCYERVFRGRASSPGRLVLGMSVGVGGAVEEIEITEETFEGRLDECVLASLRGLRLQVGDEETSRITYPVVLQPGERISTSGEDAI